MKIRPQFKKWIAEIMQIWACFMGWMGFPGGFNSKESACNAGDLGLIPELGRSPGEENGNPHQYSCLDNCHGQRSLAGYSPWGRKELDRTESLTISLFTSTIYHQSQSIRFFSNGYNYGLRDRSSEYLNTHTHTHTHTYAMSKNY